MPHLLLLLLLADMLQDAATKMSTRHLAHPTTTDSIWPRNKNKNDRNRNWGNRETEAVFMQHLLLLRLLADTLQDTPTEVLLQQRGIGRG